MIANVSFIALMLVATVTDLRDHKIYNWTTYSGIAVAVFLALLEFAAFANLADPSPSVGDGTVAHGLFSMIGIGESVSGFLVCGMVMLFCYVLFNVGAGDVKLIAMMGAFMGAGRGVEAMLWTFVLGGATGVIVLIWKMGVWKFFRTVSRVFVGKFGRGVDLVSESDRKQLQLPLYLAPNALIAVLLVQFQIVEGIM